MGGFETPRKFWITHSDQKKAESKPELQHEDCEEEFDLCSNIHLA